MRRPLLLALTLIATPASALTLTSRDVKDGQPIAAKHIYSRCGGQNVSPDLAWSGGPAGAKSYAVTMIDLSVKPAMWSHWIVVGLPPATAALPQGVKTLPRGAQNVATNFGDAGYAGPCPPTGSGVHRYELTVWALPTPAFAAQGNEKADALRARLSKAALAHASITGTVTAK